MNISQLLNTRLATQQIASTQFTTPSQIIKWMGAMQAQDYAMAKWAIGARLANCTEKDIEAAIDKGEIIRTHVLRPTWHFVSPQHIHWMLALTAPNVKALARSRDKQLELTEPIFKKANKVIQKVLQGGNHLTREELMMHLEKAKIKTGTERAIHFMLRAELDGIVCSGKAKAKKQTYALLEERAALQNKFERNEALATLARIYFTSHGPASLQDFAWWSGLLVKDCRQALEMVQQDLLNEKTGAQTYWFDKAISFEKSYKRSVYTLPAFDEYIISYKDRSALLPAVHQSKAFTNNGIFKPIIVVNGKVYGIWNRTFNKDNVIVSLNFFEQPSKSLLQLVAKRFKPFGKFLNKKVVVEQSEIRSQL